MLWTRFAANGTVQYLAACFVETAPFALQGARFRNNAHVFRAKAHVRKTREANGVVCRNDVQSARLEPLGLAWANMEQYECVYMYKGIKVCVYIYICILHIRIHIHIYVDISFYIYIYMYMDLLYIVLNIYIYISIVI